MKRKEEGKGLGREKGSIKKAKVDQSRQNGKNFKEDTTVKTFSRKNDEEAKKSSKYDSPGKGGKDPGKFSKFAKYPKPAGYEKKSDDKPALLGRKERKELTEERKKARNVNYDMTKVSAGPSDPYAGNLSEQLVLRASWSSTTHSIVHC
jgi:hypothetical protein